MTDHTPTPARETTRTPLQQLDDRREWRQQQWERRNRSAAWLIEQARREAASTGAAFVKPPRPARCGWPLGRPAIQLVDGKASITGLEHCASPWCCPVCAAIIRGRRARDLQHAADVWVDAGHGLLFATLTRPHGKRERLETGMDTITGSWADIMKSQRWRTLRATYGITHWVRGMEITWSPRNGWHCHLHLLIFTDRPATDRSAKTLQADLLDLWNDQLVRHGSRPAGKRHGVRVLPVGDAPGRVGAYMAKTPESIGSEVTRMDNKTGRKEGSIGSFQLLDQPVIDRLGRHTARRLWLEYVRATRGQKSITWSRRLRADLLGTPEQTDRQIIDDTAKGNHVIDIAADTYRSLKKQPSLLGFILSRIETGEVPVAIDVMSSVTDHPRALC